VDIVLYFSMLLNFVLISWDLSLFFAVMRYYCVVVVSLIVMIPFYIYLRNMGITIAKKSGYVWGYLNFLCTSFLFCVFGELLLVEGVVSRRRKLN
jgi:NhaP-type Na+/H+ or K+/H+ antiporter